ncbi:MAG TPA: primosomal protein N', partial [Microbacterium sp.]|nr:primosomal protein N' [Microbacterium sp.]
GPLHAARRGALPGCGWCGRPATAWACPRCSSVRVRMASSGSERTADELGRAFPGVRIIVADGEHPVSGVDAQPALVVATRGAEPIAEGGYRAVILLDGDRMLLADDLRIGESCLRWWSNAAALAAPGAPVHLVGVTGPVARALATWTQPAYARAELADRAPLRMPPTVRVAALEGTLPAVEDALSALREAVPALDDDAVLGPVPKESSARALVRFDYGLGQHVTESLRASIVADALRARKSARSRAAGGSAPNPRPADAGTQWGSAPNPRPADARHTLRVRVDVPDLDL